MTRSPLCADGCLVAEARGAHCECEIECSYMEDSMKNEDYADKSYLRPTYSQKLAEAIAYLRSINKYCLEVHHRTVIYKPAFGVPLMPRGIK